ncbi:MAG: hypothetical protein KC910_31755 [Candidatus Eremiobacteraeota bacterium]|nr:hypothetical protein [Candidatus Eremiobacteraeota bacterium]
MEIQDLGLNLSTNLSPQKWGLLQVSRARRSASSRRVEEVRERLSELLFGLNLDLGELYAYRTRILDAINLAENLEGGLELPNLDDFRTPAEQKLYRIGGLIWTPQPRPADAIQVTAEHQLHTHKLLETHRRLGALGDDGERSVVHQVGIVVAHLQEGKRMGSDVVEMTHTGFEVLTDPGQATQVARLRLPPRFPREAEILALSKSAA